MFSHTALSPFPNAILWNWATVVIFGFGNLAALDFQARCMASRTLRVAKLGCIIGGCFTLIVGIPFSYLGAITRVFFGPDSVHASFNADSCNTLLGLPSCAEWLPDEQAFQNLLTRKAPAILGGWCLIGLVAASMSTSDGAILAMGTVFSQNILRQLSPLFPHALRRERLLLMARLPTLLFAVAAGAIASFSASITGTLLIVAFDVVLATVIAPMFGCFYAHKPSARAALLSLETGAIVRIVLQFVLHRDGSFLLPYSAKEFLNYGMAANLKEPWFVDNAADRMWDPTQESCAQELFRDYSGVDSLTSFAASVIVFVAVQFIERYTGSLFCFPGDSPCEIEGSCEDNTESGEKIGLDESCERESGSNDMDTPSPGTGTIAGRV
ncbi:hypothetical protein BWQ96_00824 [Gracilariopsis chorda]|uniref:Uncharacterized protein n=1 Tax=Gracilariopsis chorda TaxID=448386 RepID=A0A2V3J4Z4_9FLOR|nr:hypothetical protein BWQ96_00824 [Gracilariopsis chorda]|eukprot:PXF49508.1 hypothetical protein BWQ96_00824 [Gracilariopsis chorda]